MKYRMDLQHSLLAIRRQNMPGGLRSTPFRILTRSVPSFCRFFWRFRFFLDNLLFYLGGRSPYPTTLIIYGIPGGVLRLSELRALLRIFALRSYSVLRSVSVVLFRNLFLGLPKACLRCFPSL